MGLNVEREKLTEQIMQNPDVTYALAGLKSLGVISADQALNQWEIAVIPKGDWEEEKGTSAIHLFPWGKDVEAGRIDKAWFMIDFGHNGTHWISCKRDAGVTTDHITISSEKVPAGTYPKRWNNVSFFTQGGSTSLRLNPDYKITSVEYHDAKNCFDAHEDREGATEIENVLVGIGRSLGLAPQDMPGRTTFNPGVLVNTILNQAQPINVPQMIASANS